MPQSQLATLFHQLKVKLPESAQVMTDFIRNHSGDSFITCDTCNIDCRVTAALCTHFAELPWTYVTSPELKLVCNLRRPQDGTVEDGLVAELHEGVQVDSISGGGASVVASAGARLREVDSVPVITLIRSLGTRLSP
jgi:hypothetical protein